MNVIFSNYDDIKNPYYQGGGSYSIHEIAKRLTSNHSVIVITGKYQGSKNERVNGVVYERVGVSIFGPKFGQLSFQLLIPFYAMVKKYDVWFESFTPPYSTAFLPLFTNKPIVGITHFLNAEDKAKQYKLPFHLIEHLGLKFYKYFIALSNSNKKKILQHNKKAVVNLIPNGSDPISKKVINLKEKDYILYLGRFDLYQKGLDLLLDAYSKVKDKIPYDLMIAGIGTETQKREIKNRIKRHNLQKRVILKGKVKGTSKYKLLSQSKFVILPSRHENHSLVALEAISVGKPLVTFNIQGFEWLSSINAVKAKAFSEVDLGKKIKSLALNQKLILKISENNIKLSKNFSWERTAEKYNLVALRLDKIKH